MLYGVQRANGDQMAARFESAEEARTTAKLFDTRYPANAPHSVIEYP